MMNLSTGTGLNHAVRVTVAALSIVLGLGAAVPAAAQCPGDLTGNQVIDGLDLAGVLSAWGTSGGELGGDVNSDGIVNGADLGVLLSAWGPCVPVLSSVTPNVGTIVGGTPITISGNYFLGTTSIMIGGVAATGIQIVNATTISAITPAGATGSAAVSVTANGRTGTLAGGFFYSNSSISSVVPSFGAAQGGGTVTITGAFLQNTTAVWFGSAPAPSFTQVSPTMVSAVTPPGAVGTSVDVRLQTPAGLLVASGAFSYVGIVVPPWSTLLEADPDPAVVTDPALRAAISATGLAWRVKDTATQIEFVLIPPGTFQMGCSLSYPDVYCEPYERLVHTVTLTNAFYMGRYEVTQAQWQARMGSNPSYFQSASTQVPAAQVPNRPVEQVSWTAVQGFLTQAGMRLPTEAEWEYAYRAGTTTAFHGFTGYLSGTNLEALVENIAWTGFTSDQSRPVGGRLGNTLGVHDMSGNIFEWVNDWFGPYSPEAQIDPTGPTIGSSRVVRGGGWGSQPEGCRASSRYGGAPDFANFLAGFRVARNP
jgi:formylglycine-generating enzyme required for sulfatase activity